MNTQPTGRAAQLRAVTAGALLVALTAACSVAPAETTPSPSNPPSAGAPTTTPPTPTALTTASPVPPPQSAAPTASAGPSPTPHVTPAPTTAPTASPSPTPVAPRVPEPIWQRVPDQESLAASMMRGVAAGPAGYVAVGVADDDIGSGLGWTSFDGRTWERVAYDFPDGRPHGIIWDGAKFVAFASTSAVWISPDGVTWSAASVVPGVEITNLLVASLDGRLYAIGRDWSEPDVDEFKTWTSADGLLWQPVFTESGPPGLGNPEGLSAANGLLIAWGFSSESEDDPSGPSALVVSSADGGRNWRSVTVGRAVNQVHDVIGLRSGVLAVGSGPYCCDAGGSWPVRAWTSPDALTWNRATFLPATGQDKLKQVVPYSGGYVALGTDYGDPMSWRTDDGRVWIQSSSVPDAAKDQTLDCTGGPCPNTYVTDLAAGDLGLVAVGQNYNEVSTEDDYYLVYRSVVWIAPPAD